MPTIEGLVQGAQHLTEHGSVNGIIQGGLTVSHGADVSITGCVQGAVRVVSGSAVVVETGGKILGSLCVDAGGQLITRPGSTIAGQMHNDGVLTVGGRQAGQVTGLGRYGLLPTAEVIQPTRGADGSYNYSL